MVEVNSEISRKRIFVTPSERKFISIVDRVSGSICDNCAVMLYTQNFELNWIKQRFFTINAFQTIQLIHNFSTFKKLFICYELFFLKQLS